MRSILTQLRLGNFALHVEIRKYKIFCLFNCDIYLTERQTFHEEGNKIIGNLKDRNDDDKLEHIMTSCILEKLHASYVNVLWEDENN